MKITKQSFLSNLIGKNNYIEFKSYAKPIIAIGTIILCTLFLLSFFLHWSFISNLLSMVTGTSLLFAIYIVSLILTLDIEVDVEEPEYNHWNKPSKIEKNKKYKYTIVWGTTLIILGICAIIFSNKYRKHYAFECDTFIIDYEKGIYHLDWDNDCEILRETRKTENRELEKIKGHEIDESIKLCSWCESWASDAETQYAPDQY